MGALPNVWPGYQAVGDAPARQRMAQAWGGADRPATPGLTGVEMRHAAVEGKSHAMDIMGENPLLSGPTITPVAAAVRALAFLGGQAIFLRETAHLAHVVVPAASALEKDGTCTKTDRRVQRLARGKPPARALGQAGSIGRVRSATTWRDALAQVMGAKDCVARAEERSGRTVLYLQATDNSSRGNPVQ